MFYTTSSYSLWTKKYKILAVGAVYSCTELSWQNALWPYPNPNICFIRIQWNPVVLMLHWGAGTLKPTTSTKTADSITFLLYKLDTEQSNLQNLLSETSRVKRGIWDFFFFFFFNYICSDIFASGMASISVYYNGFRLKSSPRKLTHIYINKYIWCKAHQCCMRHFASLQIFLNIFSLLVISYQLYSWNTR